MNPISTNTGNQQTKIQTNPNNQIQQPHGKHHKKVESNETNFSKFLETAQQTNKAK